MASKVHSLIYTSTVDTLLSYKMAHVEDRRLLNTLQQLKYWFSKLPMTCTGEHNCSIQLPSVGNNLREHDS